MMQKIIRGRKRVVVIHRINVKFAWNMACGKSGPNTQGISTWEGVTCKSCLAITALKTTSLEAPIIPKLLKEELT